MPADGDNVPEFRRRVGRIVHDLGDDGRGWILAIIAVGWLLTIGFRFFVPAILPQVKTTFGVDNATAGVAITTVWAFYGLTQFPAGLITDRLGERTMLAGSLAVSAGSLALLAASPVFAGFLVGAAAFGMGSGLYGPARGMALSKGFPDHSGAAFGLILATGSLGSAVIPLVAGVVVNVVGWRSLVVTLIPCFGAIAVLAWIVLPEPIDALASTPERGESSLPSIRDTVRGIPRAIRDRDILLAVLGMTFYLFAFQGLTAFLPTYLVTHESIDQGVAAGVFAVLFIGGGLAQLVAGSLADHYGAAPVLVGVAVVGVVTLLAVPVVDSLVVWTVLSFLLGVRMGIAPVANSYVIASLPDETQEASWGLLRSCFFLVSATGSVFVGVMADGDLFDEAFFVLAALTAVAAVCFYLLTRRPGTS